MTAFLRYVNRVKNIKWFGGLYVTRLSKLEVIIFGSKLSNFMDTK